LPLLAKRRLRAYDNKKATHNTEEQESSAWQTIREHGEKTLQDGPQPPRKHERKSGRETASLEGDSLTPFGGLKLDNAALQRDGNRVGSVACAEF
jgi:hypothetical protein